MQFQISTPQTYREDVAKQEARWASKRKIGCGSDMEPAVKKQKQFHFSIPPAPAPAQSHATTYLRPLGESPKLVDTSLPSAQAQVFDMTNLGPSTKKRKKYEHTPVAPAQSHDIPNQGQAMKEPQLDDSSVPPAQAQDTTDLGPAAKKQRLSYANLPPARVRVKISDEENTRFYAKLYRRRLSVWCKSQGFDCALFDQNIIPDTLLLSLDFDPYRYMEIQSANDHYNASGPRTLDVSRFVSSSAEDLMANSPELAAYWYTRRTLDNFSNHPPNASTSAQAQPGSREGSVHHPLDQSGVSRGCSGSGDEISHVPSVQDMTAVSSCTFGKKLNEVCPPPGDMTSTPLSSITSSLESPFRSSSDPNAGYNAKSINLDQQASVSSECDTGNAAVAANSDQSAPLLLDANLRDGSTPANSSQPPSVGPSLNKGGRPRGRKPRAPRTPKGPTRFQKNHPIKSSINIDVWENILIYCPLEFLLKARSISTTFKSVLKEDSFIWKRARLNQFGPAMPDPPLGLSEAHYADLVTGTGCQTRGCTSKKTRKTYWALGKRMCVGCFQTSFIPPRALRRVSKELDTSSIPQYNSIARYYWRMDEFLPGMKFDRWDNYQWLGEYNPTPSWGQHYRSGQYTGYSAAAYANFSSELAIFVGNEYDAEQGRFFSKEPMPGKTCPSQDAINAWFEAKRAANDALVPELQTVENWCESLKRERQKAGKDFRKDRINFYDEQAELAGLNKDCLEHFDSYQAAIAISKPVSLQSWKILYPKIMAEHEAAVKKMAEDKYADGMSEVSIEDDIMDEDLMKDDPFAKLGPLVVDDSSGDDPYDRFMLGCEG